MQAEGCADLKYQTVIPGRFLARPNRFIAKVETEEGVQTVDYRETEHYQLTKRFLDEPERMLHYLLNG